MSKVLVCSMGPDWGGGGDETAELQSLSGCMPSWSVYPDAKIAE